MSPIVHVSASRSSWHRLPCGLSPECTAAVPGHARASSRTDLRACQADQQEFTPAKARSSGIYTKIT